MGRKFVPSVIAKIDSDGDGLSDRTELSLGTNPTLRDTDGEGRKDSIRPRQHKRSLMQVRNSFR